MNKSSKKELKATSRWQTGSARAFTLTELLVVMGVGAMLAAVLLSASFTTQERVLRAECVSNLKQIGSAALVYAGENDDFLPIVSWKDAPPTGVGLPWQTYEACRIAGVGSRVITEGPYGLGLLFFGKAVGDPKTFYCPSIKSGSFAYSTYAEPGWPWPSIPPDFTGGNPYVRCSYNYYAQSKAKETVIDPTYGAVSLPALNPQSMILTSPNPGDPPQSARPYPAPLRTTMVDPTKSMSGDLLQNFESLSHKIGGAPAGVNVLFGDGHVKWVPVRGNNQKGSRQPFDPKLWDPLDANGTGPGNDSTGFRIIMNGFLP